MTTDNTQNKSSSNNSKPDGPAISAKGAIPYLTGLLAIGVTHFLALSNNWKIFIISVVVILFGVSLYLLYRFNPYGVKDRLAKNAMAYGTMILTWAGTFLGLGSAPQSQNVTTPITTAAVTAKVDPPTTPPTIIINAPGNCLNVNSGGTNTCTMPPPKDADQLPPSPTKPEPTVTAPPVVTPVVPPPDPVATVLPSTKTDPTEPTLYNTPSQAKPNELTEKDRRIMNSIFNK